ncbi:hypothetical protein GCM10020331_055820 [Ectobacillus funiculus]
MITGERHYTITNREYNFILSDADSKPVILWLEEMQWIPSTVLTMSEILELSIDWRRPVLIKKRRKKEKYYWSFNCQQVDSELTN